MTPSLHHLVFRGSNNFPNAARIDRPPFGQRVNKRLDNVEQNVKSLRVHSNLLSHVASFLARGFQVSMRPPGRAEMSGLFILTGVYAHGRTHRLSEAF
jgi:hypothetical protein